jgi:hypothetical protein
MRYFLPDKKLLYIRYELVSCQAGQVYMLETHGAATDNGSNGRQGNARIGKFRSDLAIHIAGWFS